MKHKRFNLKACALAALLAALTGFASAEEKTLSPEMIAEMEAAAQYAAELSAIAENRDSVIVGTVAAWEAVMGGNSGWSEEFTAALQATSDAQLLAIQDATSYDGIRAILQGRDAPVSLDGVIGTEALGSLTSDLVYSPVVPCRIFDTRFDVFGPPGGGNPGTILNYNVYGTAATLAPQGHIAGTGCPQPLGASAVEPIAIAANFTVVPYGQGHIRVWPYLSPQPTASFLNYNSTVNSNLANAGVVQTCFLCGPELSVSTWFGSSDSLGDVMGYFYPAEQVAPAGSRSGATTALTSICTNYSGGQVTITTPSSGYVTVTAQAWLLASHTIGTDTDVQIFLGTTATECTFSNAAEGYNTMSWSYDSTLPTASSIDITIPISRTFPVSAGTHTFYLNGIKNSGVSTVNFWFSAMQAHFTAN